MFWIWPLISKLKKCEENIGTNKASLRWLATILKLEIFLESKPSGIQFGNTCRETCRVIRGFESQTETNPKKLLYSLIPQDWHINQFCPKSDWTNFFLKKIILGISVSLASRGFPWQKKGKEMATDFRLMYFCQVNSVILLYSTFPLWIQLGRLEPYLTVLTSREYLEKLFSLSIGLEIELKLLIAFT